MPTCSANDLSPPILPGETRTAGFDFGLVLNAGVTILSIQSVVCTVSYGVDATPANRLIGNPTIIASAQTGAAAAAVAQNIGTMLDGVTYLLVCYVNTSDGQVLAIQTHISCAAPE